jgi:hypothetical protein
VFLLFVLGFDIKRYSIVFENSEGNLADENGEGHPLAPSGGGRGRKIGSQLTQGGGSKSGVPNSATKQGPIEDDRFAKRGAFSLGWHMSSLQDFELRWRVGE